MRRDELSEIRQCYWCGGWFRDPREHSCGDTGLPVPTVADESATTAVGVVTYRCRADGTEFQARAELFDGNMDPAAIDNGDRCPTCGKECDGVIDWEPSE